MSTDTAVILAAGLGSRLQGQHDGPKGLVAVDGEPLIGRSLRLLRTYGVRRTLIVTGYQAPAYERFFASHADVELVPNPAYARSGTYVSLQCALSHVRSSFLLLEGDIFYEPRALAVLLEDPRPDVVLASGFTHATDEVFISCPNGMLQDMSKDPSMLSSCDAELVGIAKLSAEAGAELLAAVPAHPHACYDTDALIQLASKRAIAVAIVDDLRWGEVDDAAHLKRVRERVAPSLRR